MAEKFCKVCGAPLSDDDRFCPNCGAKVNTAEEITAETLDSYTPAEEPVIEEPEEELGGAEPALEPVAEPEPQPEEEPAAEEPVKEEPEVKKENKAAEAMKGASESAKKAAATVGTALSQGAKAVSGSPITKNLLSLLKNLWLDPAKTIEKHSTGEHFYDSLIVVALTSLMLMLLVLRLISKAGNAFSMMMYGYNFLSHIPASFYISIFLVGIAAAFIFAALFWLVVKFLFRKKEYSFKAAFSSVGVAAAFLCYGLLAAILVSFLSQFIAYILVLFSFVMAVIGLFISLLTVAECRPNQAMYTLAIVHVLGYLAISGLIYLSTVRLL